MDVVDKSVVDSGRGKSGGELRLPDALGDPSTGGATAEMVFEIGGQADDLFALVLGRDGDKDGFVKPAADQLDLARADEGFQATEIFGTILFNPGEQRAGIVEAHVDAGMFFEQFDEWEIRVLVGLLKHVAEIAAGLMGMNQEDEMKAIGHRDNLALKHHNVSHDIFRIQEMIKMR